MPSSPVTPSHEARIRRDQAAHARELARNLSDQQTIDNLHAYARKLEQEASALEAQAIASSQAAEAPDAGAEQASAPTTADVGAERKEMDVAADEAKPSTQDS